MNPKSKKELATEETRLVAAEQKGYELGYKSGIKQGSQEGKKEGYTEGKRDGLSEGVKSGVEAGHQTGKKEGLKEAKDIIDQRNHQRGASDTRIAFVATVEQKMAEHDGYSNVKKWREEALIPAWWIAVLITHFEPSYKKSVVPIEIEVPKTF